MTVDKLFRSTLRGVYGFSAGAVLGFALFFIACFAMGYYSAAHGLAVPQVSQPELQSFPIVGGLIHE
ncbi:hypothetical protein [Microbacterium sp. KR10-403]|uniref:hypothetical protein n=1 Tax=Microbacterium sp. KR10-403 TaxID=3158581 RepID=UPI0032E4995B